jgi:hypothetical protein
MSRLLLAVGVLVSVVAVACSDTTATGGIHPGLVGSGTADGFIASKDADVGTQTEDSADQDSADQDSAGPDSADHDGAIEPDGGPEPDGIVPADTVTDPDATADADGAIGPDGGVDIGPIGCTGDGDCGPEEICGAIGLCVPACLSGCDDGNPCTIDTCSKLAKQCQHAPAPLTTACEADGSACTVDHCSQGACVAGPGKLCADQNPCTSDTCSPISGECSFAPQTGAACEDGNACTVGDTCQGVACLAGTMKSCDDANTCTIDSCNPATGQCAFDPVGDGTSCTDGNKCTTGDSCNVGKCKGKPLQCQDGNACTDDFCDGASGCQHPSLDGAPCDDGLTCTQGELCQAGACKAPAAQSCDDGNPCTIDGCAQGAGCTHTPSGAGCSDGTACTVGDSCATGSCVGKPVACDDGNPCTTDSCDAKQGCQHVDNAAQCNDGNPCTLGDLCAGGSCVAGQGLGCDDNIACTLDTCDPKTGGCQHAPQAGGCDDGNACTFDSCGVQGCVHQTIPNCCGGKQCASGEICIAYPDTLAAFCAKPCNTGNDCPGSCCYMTFKTKHCLTPTFQAECCSTSEYWATETDPYACGKGGKGQCVNYPNPQKPFYPSAVTICSAECKGNQDCPGTCCSGTTLGNDTCVAPAYKSMLCGGF